MAKVSVISGYYNRSKVLERTISSILNQSFKDLELLVFDDCSPDDSQNELKRLKEKFDDSRFEYTIHKENKGFVQGLIDAIASTDSEYIAIQGSGDVSLPERIELQAKYLDAHPNVGVVGGWLYNIEENGGAKALHQPTPGTLSFADLEKTDPPFTHGEVMIRRSALLAAGGYRSAFKFSQDYDLWYRISKVADIAIIPNLIYHRYTLLDGVSFVPSKTVVQKCYALAAKRMSVMNAEEEDLAYQLLLEDGPNALVPISDKEVQSFVPKAAIRLGVFGDKSIAIGMAEEFIVSKPIKFVTKILIFGISSPVSRPLLIGALKVVRNLRRRKAVSLSNLRLQRFC